MRKSVNERTSKISLHISFKSKYCWLTEILGLVKMVLIFLSCYKVLVLLIAKSVAFLRRPFADAINAQPYEISNKRDLIADIRYVWLQKQYKTVAAVPSLVRLLFFSGEWSF